MTSHQSEDHTAVFITLNNFVAEGSLTNQLNFLKRTDDSDRVCHAKKFRFCAV